MWKIGIYCKFHEITSYKYLSKKRIKYWNCQRKICKNKNNLK